MYLPIEKSIKLKHGQMVICKCPEWNEEGLQIATWNGVEFEYSGQQNDSFHGLVTAFIPIDEDGACYPDFYDGYNQNQYRR